MIRHKWIVGLRNKLAELAGKCNSCAAIEGSKLSSSEREKIQVDLRKVIDYIDKKILMNAVDFKFWLENNYPTTIVNDRYSGTYSGGLWTCWPLDWRDIPKEIEASDPECQLFWDNYDKSTVGIGSTPDSAMMDLELKLTNKIHERYNSKRPV